MGDRPFYESAYAQRLAELNDLRSKNLLGEDIAKMTDEQFDTFAKLSAKLDGLTATYQDSSAAADALTDVKKFAGDLSKSMFGVDIMSQFSAPFVRTPGNIIQRAVEYSPVGIIKNVGTIKKIFTLCLGDKISTKDVLLMNLEETFLEQEYSQVVQHLLRMALSMVLILMMLMLLMLREMAV